MRRRLKRPYVINVAYYLKRLNSTFPRIDYFSPLKHNLLSPKNKSINILLLAFFQSEGLLLTDPLSFYLSENILILLSF